MTKRKSSSKDGMYFGTGTGPNLQLIDISHPEYMTVIEADTAYWCLVKKNELVKTLSGGIIGEHFTKYRSRIKKEMNTLRFGLSPAAVYFNPTDKCNLNCSYCYLPESMRKNGNDMPLENIIDALGRIKRYFKGKLKNRKPQIIFHGAEPLINKKNVFTAIRRYHKNFNFGIQTNATLLTDDDIKFLQEKNVMLGVSLDGHIPSIANRTRKRWNGKGSYNDVLEIIKKCVGYPGFNVICTVSKQNVGQLTEMVGFLHGLGVENCLLNPVRCTLPGGRADKPDDITLSKNFIRALEESKRLYKKTGRKLIIVNFSNILLSILAPTARKLMCDISPCGGGRCFFAVAANGDVSPCSEFIGLKEFKGGNIFNDRIGDILESPPFRDVTNRSIENIEYCRTCAIRHFCGSPCPAEAYTLNGTLQSQGAFCRFYEEQVRYAFRVIAEQVEDNFLWDDWDKDTKDVF